MLKIAKQLRRYNEVELAGLIKSGRAYIDSANGVDYVLPTVSGGTTSAIATFDVAGKTAGDAMVAAAGSPVLTTVGGTFAATDSNLGTLCVHCIPSSTWYGWDNATWGGFITAVHYGRYCFKIHTSGADTLRNGVANFDGGYQWRITLGGSPSRVYIVNSSGSIEVQSTQDLALDVWHWLEYKIDYANGISVKIYDAITDTTPIETLTNVGAGNIGTRTDWLIHGTGMAGGDVSADMYFDQVVAGAASYPGSPVTAGTAYTDTGTENLKLSPSGVDVYPNVDTATGRVTLSPSGVDLKSLKQIQRPVGPLAITTSLATAYTVPTGKKFIVRDIQICNTSGAQRAVTLKIGGQSIFYNQPLDINGTLPWTGWEVMLSGEQLQVQADATGCTIVVSGVEV